VLILRTLKVSFGYCSKDGSIRGQREEHLDSRGTAEVLWGGFHDAKPGRVSDGTSGHERLTFADNPELNRVVGSICGGNGAAAESR
jgi:hypothetical protein